MAICGCMMLYFHMNGLGSVLDAASSDLNLFMIGTFGINMSSTLSYHRNFVHDPALTCEEQAAATPGLDQHAASIAEVGDGFNP